MQVFISYVSEDEPFVESLYTVLKERGVFIWKDNRTLKGGENWKDKIKEAINKSTYFIGVLSENSIHKKDSYFDKELKIALSIQAGQQNFNNFVIPVNIDRSPIPDALSHLHIIDCLTDFEQGVSQILYSLSTKPIHHLKPESDLNHLLLFFHNRSDVLLNLQRVEFFIRSAYRNQFPAICWENELVRQAGNGALESYLISLTAQDQHIIVREFAFKRLQQINVFTCLDKYQGRIVDIIEDESEDERIRIAAIHLAGRLCAPDIVRSLTLLLMDNLQSAEIGVGAVRALGEINTPAARKNLISSLKNIQLPYQVIDAIMVCLIDSSHDITTALEVVIKVYRRFNVKYQIPETVLIGIKKLLPRIYSVPLAEIALDILESTAHISDFRDHACSIYTGLAQYVDIGRVSDRLVNILFEFTNGSAPKEIKAVIAKHVSPKIINRLFQGLNDENWFVRENCLTTIAIIRGSVSREFFDGIGETTSAYVLIAKTIIHVKNDEYDYPLEMLNFPNSKVRWEAFKALCCVRNKQVFHRLQDHLISLKKDILVRLDNIPDRINVHPILDIYDSWIPPKGWSLEQARHMLLQAFEKEPVLFDKVEQLRTQVEAVAVMAQSGDEQNNGSLNNIYTLADNLLHCLDYLSDPAKSGFPEAPYDELIVKSRRLIKYSESDSTDQEVLNASSSGGLPVFVKEGIKASRPIVDFIEEANDLMGISNEIQSYNDMTACVVASIQSNCRKGAKDRIFTILQDKDFKGNQEVHNACIGALADIANTSDILTPLLSQTRDTYLKRKILEALGKQTNPSSLEIIKNEVDSPSPLIRAQALKTLCNINPDHALTASMEKLQDADERVVIAAIEILVSFGGEKHIDLLIDRSRNLSIETQSLLDRAIETLVQRSVQTEGPYMPGC